MNARAAGLFQTGPCSIMELYERPRGAKALNHRYPYANEAATAPREVAETPEVERQDRKRQAAALLRQWLAEPEEYDHEVWPLVTLHTKRIAL